jgi:ABC-type phosphate transport system substrate-binding protein
MRAGKLLTVSGLALMLTLAGCGSGGGPSAQSGGPTTAESGVPTTTRSDGSTTSAAAEPTKDLCATVNKLGKSVAAIRSGSPAESQAKLDAAREDYEAVKRAAAGELSIQAGDVGQAMTDLENEMGASGPQAADKLAQAYDRLDAATDCP